MTERIYPLGVVLQRIKAVLENDDVLSETWIEAEVSRFQIWNSGHAYFTLKDESGVIDGMMWKARLRRQSFVPRVGDQVIVKGSVTIYEQRGQLQFDAEVFQPAGTGILQARFEALRQRLEAEGLFDESRKRPLPLFPRRVGVVTSPSGAVWHDIQRVVERRYPMVELVLAPAVVQGDAAPASIVRALWTLQQAEGIDVIVVARGGGSAEDLWCFNDEAVVRAIFAASVPVISAVGHETDFTLSDFVADLRAPTPSVAGELVVPDRIQVMQLIEGMRATARALVLDEIQYRLADVQSYAHRLLHVSPERQLVAMENTATTLRTRARYAIERTLESRQARIDRLGAVLEVLDPSRLLESGYVHLADSGGANVRRAADLREGDRVRATFADGYADLAAASIMIESAASPSRDRR